MDFETARRNMVESQLRTNRVTDPRLLSAFASVPREIFVPKGRQQIAYIDEDLPIGGDRYLMEPMVLARMLQEAWISDSDNVLVVGAAPGYGAAIAGRVAGSVFALESDGALASAMASTLTGLAIDNVVVVEGAHAEGFAKEGPYDVILLNGAVPRVPDALSEQLNEGGRLLSVVEDQDGLGRCTLGVKRRGVTSSRVLFDANVRRLPGFEVQSGFVF